MNRSSEARAYARGLGPRSGITSTASQGKIVKCGYPHVSSFLELQAASSDDGVSNDDDMRS
jgi:hypothetical protein